MNHQSPSRRRMSPERVLVGRSTQVRSSSSSISGNNGGISGSNRHSPVVVRHIHRKISDELKIRNFEEKTSGSYSSSSSFEKRLQMSSKNISSCSNADKAVSKNDDTASKPMMGNRNRSSSKESNMVLKTPMLTRILMKFEEDMPSYCEILANPSTSNGRAAASLLDSSWSHSSSTWHIF